MRLLPEQLELTVFIKITRDIYVPDFQSGKLYMNNLKYYVDLEKETQKRGIGDIREASLANIYKHELFIQVNGEERRKIPIGPAPGIIYDNEALFHPVFCSIGKVFVLDKINDKQYVGEISLKREEIEDFIDGTNSYKAIVVFNVIEFLERIYATAYKLKIAGKHGFIKYRDIKFPNVIDGKWILDDTFTKDIRFKNQSEFRMELFTHAEQAFVLDVGDLHDVSIAIECEKLLSGLSIIQTIDDIDEL